MEYVYNKILNQLPDSIDLGFITVKNETITSFILINHSDQSILYDIESLKVYEIENPHGVLEKHSKTEIKVKIKPDNAVVLIGNARIRLDKTDKYSKILKFSSIAKYPYLRIDKTILDFGNVLIGKTKEMEIIITNPEKVTAKFIIKKKTLQQGKELEQFILSDMSGEIPPESNFLLKIKYKTMYANYFISESYEIKTLGGNKNRFSCMGYTSSLNTRVNARYVNFGSIELTQQTTRLIRLYNESDELTFYQFFYYNSGCFDICNLEGIIPAKSNVRVIITFKPRETMTYYDRVFCLIKNHYLFALDLYGSCHDLLNKTKVIEQKHIDTFRYKIAHGYFIKISSKDENLLDSLLINSSYNKYKKNVVKDRISLDGIDDVTEDSVTAIQIHKELFWESNSNTKLFFANTDYIDFRCVENGKISEPFILTIFNNSNEKIKLKWLLDKSINTSNLTKNQNLLGEDMNFIVMPEEQLVGGKSRVEFKVYFKPNKQEFYFFSHLKCLGILQTDYDNKNQLSQKGIDLRNGFLRKSSRLSILKTNFIKMNDNTEKPFDYFDPPIPLKINVVGHSFPPNTQIFMPMMEVIPNKEIIFTPCSIQQSSYQSIMIKNNSDTPLYFKSYEDISNVFRIHPVCGLVSPKSFNLVMLEFCPNIINTYKYPLKIIFNHDIQNTHILNLHGLCVDPYIELENISNDIYFPPSFIGINTNKTLTIINKSPLNVNVELNIIPNENAIISIEPSYFEMYGNEIRKINMYLCPLKNNDINSKLEIRVSRIYDPRSEWIGVYNPGSHYMKGDSDKRLFYRSFNILGSGSDGELLIEPAILNFETVKVGFHKKLTFSIKNPTICNFYIKLLFPPDHNDKESIFSLDFKEGLINSLCRKDVNVTFKPVNRANIKFKISLYATHDPNDKMINNFIANHQFSEQFSLKSEISIEANGNYPLIKIVDIRNKEIGTSSLWKAFNIDDANNELLENLTEEEINFINTDKTHKRISNYYEKLKCVKFDFGKQTFKKSRITNMEVFLTLQNVGGVTSEFFFKFPEDINVKREIWMEPIDTDSHHPDEFKVLKDKIFEIDPRKNKLNPGECCNIRFRYNIKEIGEHNLKIMFQIVNGKPIVFNLYGECHSEKNTILEIPNPIIDFHYVPMGYTIPIVKPIEIRNLGGVKLKYFPDEKVIKNYTLKNDEFEIFRFDKYTEDSISAGDTKYLITSFRPLTNKEYILKIPIYYYYDDPNKRRTLNITLRGFGYHPTLQKIPVFHSIYHNMPKYKIYNKYDNSRIQKCELSVEEIDFGIVDDKPICKTFILYNFSSTESFNFEFKNSGFSMKDEILFEPSKGIVEPNNQIIIRTTLAPKDTNFTIYEGEIEVRIVWMYTDSNRIVDKEKLFIRILKKSMLKDINKDSESKLSTNIQGCFVENMLNEWIKEILTNKDFDNLICDNIDNQPLGMYQWTDDNLYESHEDVRSRMLNNYFRFGAMDLNSSINKKLFSKDSRLSTLHKKSDGYSPFNELEDQKLEEKYLNALLNKHKYTIPEINEKTLVVNEPSRKWVNDILEQTVFNIIAECINGHSDLTVKTAIYFKK